MDSFFEMLGVAAVVAWFLGSCNLIDFKVCIGKPGECVIQHKPTPPTPTERKD